MADLYVIDHIGEKKLDMGEVRGAIARGWCHTDRVFDADIAVGVATEVLKLSLIQQQRINKLIEQFTGPTGGWLIAPSELKQHLLFLVEK